MSANVAAARSRQSWLGVLARWESLLVVAIAGLVVLGTFLSPFFLTPGNFSNLIAALMEVAIMALPMTLIIVAGEIDLSVESMAGLASALTGFLWAAGVPLVVAIPIVLLVGALGGLLNGLLVARGRLPSLVVTLGTLALFRGLALIVLGPRGISNFPPEFTELGFGHVPGTLIPWPFVIFLGLAGILGVVLHRTWIGRHIYAIGRNTGAARFSGVRVVRVRTGLFVLSGLIAALAGIILTSRLSSARADAGAGMTLTVVTVVLLGGVNIFGGSGTIPGVALAVVAVAVMQNALRLASVTVEVQSIALGLLLILSVVIPNFAHQAKSAIDRVRGGRPPPADSVRRGEAPAG
ncbi:MAG TPA: ABC transporter permease [Candidatus Limnocylindrales bacterium]|jgi:rhamnose transport system permease protein|nr:ABC transporter permease [Candidatus Limnocylindrales bacterium]